MKQNARKRGREPYAVSTPFFIDFSSILAPFGEPDARKLPSRRRPETRQILERFFDAKSAFRKSTREADIFWGKAARPGGRKRQGRGVSPAGKG